MRSFTPGSFPGCSDSVPPSCLAAGKHQVSARYIPAQGAASRDAVKARDALLQALRDEEPELRRRGIESLLLFGSAATLKSFPNDIDLLARFRPELRLSAFDIAEIQAYLEQTLGGRVDLSTEATFPSEFRKTAEQSGIRIFGS
jgi:predicted nucleotidyltransferase